MSCLMVNRARILIHFDGEIPVAAVIAPASFENLYWLMYFLMKCKCTCKKGIHVNLVDNGYVFKWHELQWLFTSYMKWLIPLINILLCQYVRVWNESKKIACFILLVSPARPTYYVQKNSARPTCAEQNHYARPTCAEQNHYDRDGGAEHCFTKHACVPY